MTVYRLKTKSGTPEILAFDAHDENFVIHHNSIEWCCECNKPWNVHKNLHSAPLMCSNAGIAQALDEYHWLSTNVCLPVEAKSGIENVGKRLRSQYNKLIDMQIHWVGKVSTKFSCTIATWLHITHTKSVTHR